MVIMEEVISIFIEHWPEPFFCIFRINTHTRSIFLLIDGFPATVRSFATAADAIPATGQSVRVCPRMRDESWQILQQMTLNHAVRVSRTRAYDGLPVVTFVLHGVAMHVVYTPRQDRHHGNLKQGACRSCSAEVRLTVQLIIDVHGFVVCVQIVDVELVQAFQLTKK
jgi:hypothetical protein